MFSSKGKNKKGQIRDNVLFPKPIHNSPHCNNCSTPYKINQLYCTKCGSEVGLGTAKAYLLEASQRPGKTGPVYSAEALSLYPNDKLRITGQDALKSKVKEGNPWALESLAGLPDPQPRMWVSQYIVEHFNKNDGIRYSSLIKSMIKADQWEDSLIDVLLGKLSSFADKEDIEGLHAILELLSSCPSEKAREILFTSLYTESAGPVFLKFTQTRWMLKFGNDSERAQAVAHFENEYNQRTVHQEGIWACEELAHSPDQHVREKCLDMVMSLADGIIEDENTNILNAILRIPESKTGIVLAELLRKAGYGGGIYAELANNISTLSSEAKASFCDSLADDLARNPYDFYVQAAVLQFWGICGCSKYINKIREFRQHPEIALREQAMLALARLGDIECVNWVCTELVDVLNGTSDRIDRMQEAMEMWDNRKLASIVALSHLLSIISDISEPEIAVQTVPYAAMALKHDDDGIIRRSSQVIAEIARRLLLQMGAINQ